MFIVPGKRRMLLYDGKIINSHAQESEMLGGGQLSAIQWKTNSTLNLRRRHQAVDIEKCFDKFSLFSFRFSPSN